MRYVVFLLLIGSAASHAQEPKSGAKVDPFARWEKAIEAFERADAAKPPPKQAILFAGSSSIVLWNLKKSFPDREVINRGFGGSQIRDSVHFMDRIITPHQPRLVVFYAGDNDIAAGRSADDVVTDFRAFVAKLHQASPKTKVIFLAIKPSPNRWKWLDVQKKANALVEAECKKDERLRYLDLVTPMLGEDGLPQVDLYAKDKLHLSDKGYQLWTAKLAPLLD